MEKIENLDLKGFIMMPVDVKQLLEKVPDSIAKREIEKAYLKSLPQMVNLKKIEAGEVHKTIGKCPSCSKTFIDNFTDIKFCPKCGQRILFQKGG